MRIFVTGATGIVGRPVVRLLAGAGHEARGLARSKVNAAMIEADGGAPVEADLFEPWTLREAMAGCDAVMHLATRIPASVNAARPGAWDENDRIRRDGTRNLVDAALAAGARVVIYPSVVFVYPDSGAAWIDAASAPVAASPILASTLAAEAEIERFAASGGAGIVLRMGAFYGPDASSTQEMLATARRGTPPFPGALHAYRSFIWIADAASALAAALDAPAGIYDVVDDEPMTRGALNDLLMGVAAKRSRLPSLGRIFGGPAVRSERVSNARFKAASGWRPSMPGVRDGFARIAARGVSK